MEASGLLFIFPLSDNELVDRCNLQYQEQTGANGVARKLIKKTALIVNSWNKNT